MTDKTQAVIDFIKTCPNLSDKPMYFNFADTEDDAYQFNIRSNDVYLQKPFIDGSVLKRFICEIDSFKSLAYNVNIETSGTNENFEDYADVQAVIDWILEKEELREYPDFGENCIIDEMRTVSTTPELLGVNTQLNAPVAVYRITLQIDYLDTSKKIWNK